MEKSGTKAADTKIRHQAGTHRPKANSEFLENVPRGVNFFRCFYLHYGTGLSRLAALLATAFTGAADA